MNKKVLMLAPFMGLLLTSCSPWQSISYEKAKEFVDRNYQIDGAKAIYPTKVHETFKASAADELSKTQATAMAAMGGFFYSFAVMDRLDWSTEAPYKCNYNSDYIPGEDLLDFPIFPLASGYITEVTTDYLFVSDKDAGSTVTYYVNGKQFKQNVSAKNEITSMSTSATYNSKGYRTKVTGKCNWDGEMTDPTTGKKVTIKFNFTYSGTYTYAE